MQQETVGNQLDQSLVNNLQCSVFICRFYFVQVKLLVICRLYYGSVLLLLSYRVTAHHRITDCLCVHLPKESLGILELQNSL